MTISNEKFPEAYPGGIIDRRSDETVYRGIPDPMNDVSVILALADLQMDMLQPEIKRRALAMIEERKDIESWVDPNKRIKELEAFKQKLLRN